ncbi:hypothetical protein FOA52_001001 [Chlamydomonas sp. UWO 241]|nr:hypothetical protein FOA52_001001 [Chlamydomonas sp. UWO 241]
MLLEAPDLSHAALPESLRGAQLWVDAAVASTSASKQAADSCASTSKGGSSFKFGKALSAVGNAADESACCSRGDGKFEDGTSIKRQGNYVTLGPEAMKPEHAEATLAALDAMQAGRQRPDHPYGADLSALQRTMAGAGGPTNPPPRSTRGHAKFSSVQDAAAGVLFDVGGDEPGRCGRGAAAPAAPAAPGLPVPEHESVEVESGGARVLEIRISLPLLSSAAAAELDIGDTSVSVSVPGRYAFLRIALPKGVDAGVAKAKWRKATAQLVVTLPVISP